EDARQEAGLAQDLKSVAGAEDQPAASDEIAQRFDDRRASGHRARTQVVAVREAARQDHAVELAQVALAMPHVPYGLMEDLGDHVVEIAVAPRAREDDDTESHGVLILTCDLARGKVGQGLDREILQNRVRQQLRAHLADARASIRGRVVELELDELADS